MSRDYEPEPEPQDEEQRRYEEEEPEPLSPALRWVATLGRGAAGRTS